MRRRDFLKLLGSEHAAIRLFRTVNAIPALRSTGLSYYPSLSARKITA
jgi:hypothetical protein